MRSIRLPVAVIGVGTAAVIVFMMLSGMGPEVLLVAALGALVGLGVWALGELADATPTTGVSILGRRGDPVARADRRVERLRSGLAHGRPDGVMLERLHDTLVEVVDDQLRVEYQIERSDDPDAARLVIGDELQAFIDDPDAPATLLRPDRLGRVLTMIERL